MTKQKNDPNAPHVKIFWFEKLSTERSERELDTLLEQGWHIAGTGGTGGGGSKWGGFVLLVRERGTYMVENDADESTG